MRPPLGHHLHTPRRDLDLDDCDLDLISDLSSLQSVPTSTTQNLDLEPLHTIRIMAQRYIQPAAPPSEQTFQKDLFVGKVVLSTGGRSGIVNKMIRMMMKHGADSVIIGRKSVFVVIIQSSHILALLNTPATSSS
jgi:hypothetical protein